MTATKESAASPTLLNAISRMSAASCCNDTELGKFVYATCNELVAPLEALAATPAPVPGPRLSDERIVELYRESFNAMIGRLREAPKSVPDTVLTFARAIESDLRADLASVPGQSEPVHQVAIGGDAWTDITSRACEAFKLAGTTVRTLYSAQPAPVSGATFDEPVATVIKKGADRQWMSESLGSLPDGMYSLYLHPAPAGAVVAPDLRWRVEYRDDMGFVFDVDGNRIASMYAKEACTIVAAHNATIDPIPAPQSPDTPVAPKRPLKRCASNRDGDCVHPECPQLRDNEPHATGRHCPIDTSAEDEQ